jgi:F0F1-type ATP synthase membrane subunit c/vacuolar-type H+-ATPase subunit K
MNRAFSGFLATVSLGLLVFLVAPVNAVEQQAPLIGELGSKTFAAAIAFAAAVASAGFGIARAGSAGLAAAAERLEVRTTAIIISAFAEALGIYGIVIAFFILAA